MQTTGRLTGQRIGALLAALRRWLRYAADKQYTANAPTPLQLGEFLRMVAQGGLTAASSMYQALKWFRLNFGLPFNTDHWLTQPFRLLPRDHQVQQRTELQPWELVNLLLLMPRCRFKKFVNNTSKTAWVLVAFFATSLVCGSDAAAECSIGGRPGIPVNELPHPAFGTPLRLRGDHRVPIAGCQPQPARPSVVIVGATIGQSPQGADLKGLLRAQGTLTCLQLSHQSAAMLPDAHDVLACLHAIVAKQGHQSL